MDDSAAEERPSLGVDEVALILSRLPLGERARCALVSSLWARGYAQSIATALHLDLAGAGKLTDDDFAAILRRARSVTSIAAYCVDSISAEAIALLSAPGLPISSRLVRADLRGTLIDAHALFRLWALPTLEALDVSWCRGVSDQPLGALVDRCAALRKLTIWGCSQLTPLFFNGHKNDALEVVGRGRGSEF